MQSKSQRIAAPPERPTRFPPKGRAPFGSVLPAALLVVAGLAFLSGGHANAGEAAAQRPALRLRVPRSLPVVGERQTLTAVIRFETAAVIDSRVVFVLADDPAGNPVLAIRPAPLTPDGETVVVETEWTPRATGDHTLVARLEARNGNGWDVLGEAAQTVTAARRLLHFHHWSVYPELRFITEGMINNEDLLEYWADRGVIVQHYETGNARYSNWKSGQKERDPDPEEFVRHMEEDLGRGAYERGWPGIVIDELHGPTEIDQILGQAIARRRKMRPDLYMAVYAVSVGGEQMIEGLHAADRTLVESYLAAPSYQHGTWDYHRHQRYQSAVNAGLGDKALLALGLSLPSCNGDGITTPLGLRRQLHWVRYAFPDMAGIAFFGGIRDVNLGDIDLDSQLRAFYVNPVLHAEVLEGGRVRIRNIGGDDSPATRISVSYGVDGASEHEVDVPALAVDKHHVVALEGEHLCPVTEYRPGLYVLGPPMLGNREPAAFRPGATAAWPVPGSVVSAISQDTVAEPVPETPGARDAHEGDDAEKGEPTTLSCDIPRTQGRSFQFSFDWRATRVGFASMNIALDEQDGKSQLNLGLSSSQGYSDEASFRVRLRNEKGVEVSEWLPTKIHQDVLYRLRALYHSDGYLRVAIHDEADEKLWDSGEVPTYGRMNISRLRFSVRDGEGGGAALRWDADNKAVFMRAVGWHSSHVMEGHITHLALDVYDR